MTNRLRVLVLTTLAGALALVAGGCGDDDDEDTTTTAAEPAAVEEYVGALDGADTEADSDQATAGQYFVAVTINGEDVLAYACDSVNPGELFTGGLDGDQIKLESEDRNATLSATVTDSGVEGELTVDGESQAFETTLAESIGGLYTLTPDGRTVTGESVRGNLFEVIYDTATYDYEGTFTTADGEELPAEGDFREPQREAGGYDDYRAVVLDTGVSRGIRTARARPVEGTPFTDPDMDP